MGVTPQLPEMICDNEIYLRSAANISVEQRPVGPDRLTCCPAQNAM